MLAQQRQSQILARLSDAGGVRVADLARTLEVSEETIRRDLEQLGRTGRLVRTHGGAVPVPEERRDPPFDVRQTAHHAEKRAIALAAVRHVADGDVLALDASSTAYELACVLPDLPVTVITNSVPTSAALVGRRNVRVICTGGVLENRTRSFLGSLAEDALKRFNITKLFLSAKGIDPARGLSEVADEQARYKRCLLDLAAQAYLLLDHTKLGVRSVVFFAPVTEVNLLITDAAADAGVLRELHERGLQTQIAGEDPSTLPERSVR
ncbi:MAG: DeoR/GlpR family DNA-binding transcription regulator [Planctomycetota bacterium]